MSLPLLNVTIALIAPRTYDYSSAIQKELVNLGATVLQHEECTEGAWLGLSRRLGLSKWIARLRQNKFLMQLSRYEIDCLLVIRGSTLSASFLEAFKLRFPVAKRVMYQWDSRQNNDYAELIDHFDWCASFDSKDCAQLSLQYLPLFYVRDLEETPKAASEYDLCMIGAFTENRYAFYLDVQRQADHAGLRLKTYFFQPWVAKLKNFIAGRNRNTLTVRLDRQTVYQYMSKSHCIVDVHHPAQSGLTMRTIEALALGKKLITTNPAIRNEAFFDANMISVVDSNNPVIDLEWLAAPLSQFNIKQLRLDNWLIGLLQPVLNSES